jgi:alpha-galactosidase
MLAAPLIAGNDLRGMTQSIKDILMNREVIAIDQDAAGKQGTRISPAGDQEIWVRQLSGGARAIALFNKSASPAKMTVKWNDAGLHAAPKHARDLWTHSDIAVNGTEFSAEVPSHGVILLRTNK